ncbi:porin OmpC [Duffyella gerundensis]|uniref:Outer membrane protein Omp-EA n=1 Tax=Duffyella gerundensis TaxID=1619313 RepID=A0A0U5GIZ4_9GAMM|nr:porin [Duffyella gerundensis]QTO53465.1 porin [Duffyella gerundensis]UCB31973.1 porin OmpC [Duffyella gerundensis]CUU23121.1 Outer membrane protein Omp-EA [Duffyella gerundensis]
MNKRVLALTITALLASASSQAAEVYNKDGNRLDFYGKVKAMRYMSDADTNASNNTDKTYVRIGFKGQTQINDMMTGYGQWEYQYNANNSEGSDANTGNKTRLGFAGIKFSDFGSIDYGRNYGLIYDVEAITDMMPEFGATAYTSADVYMLTRTNGVATWRNTNFFGLIDGLDVALQYQGKNESSGRSNNASNGDGMAGSISYKIIDGLSIKGAVSSSNRTVAQKNSAFGQGDTAEAWATGLKYDKDGVYLAANYAETRNMNPISGTAQVGGNNVAVSGYANKLQNIEIVAQYQFDFGLRPSLAYVQSKVKDIEGGVGDADYTKFADVGATYYFNKNMSAFVDYKINLLDDDNTLARNTDDIVAVGVTYQF